MAEDKQLPASSKRREELRRRGQVVRSQEIGTVVQVGVGLFGLLLIGPVLATGMGMFMMNSFGQIKGQVAISGLTVVHTPLNWLLCLFGFFVALFLSAIIAQVAQVGFYMADEVLEPKWDKLNPINGLKQLFSLRRLVTTVQAAVKLAVIVLFAGFAARDLFNSDVFLRPVNAVELGAFLGTVAWQIGWRVLLATGVIAAVDYLYQRWQFERDNRMSLDEYKDEFKQQEGSPEIKRKRRQIMRRRSLRRMLEDMKDNTIVITNPTHYAVALRYRRGDTAVPVIMGKGMRLVAKRLKEEAMTWHVPIIENPPLARGLYKHGKVGEPIPALYYQAVAAILAQLFRRGYRSTEAPEGFYGGSATPPEPSGLETPRPDLPRGLES